MISYLQAIVLGVVEGVTEFLPISSTAHLILSSKLMGLPSNESLALFEVVIQSGAILAVAIMYVRYVWANMRLIPLILASFVPTAIIGFVAHDFVKTILFDSTTTIALALIVVGLVFLLSEHLIDNKKLILDKSLDELDYKDALVIGTVQALAIVPGVSRAGIVMLGMMGRRYQRSEAALYSFLLAVPTIVAASALDLYQSRELLSGNADLWSVLAIGFIVSGLVAFVAVAWLVKYLQTNNLRPFAYYRIALGALILLLINN